MTNAARSQGLWDVTAPPAPETPALDGQLSAEVAVVGAGYTGLSAALHLAEAGRTVVVLEAERVGFGASGRNVGLVNAGMWTMPSALHRALGERHGERLLRFLGDAPAEVFSLIRRHGIACEAVENGTLHCAVGQRGLNEVTQRAKEWQERGAPVELLDAGMTRQRIGGGDFTGALLDRRAGTIQPLAYVRGLASAAMAAGVRIHGGSAVTGFERRGGNWEVRTARGKVTAPWLILATETYTKGVCPDLGRELVRLPYFNMATPPLPADLRAGILPGREGCWDTRQVLSSFRLDATGRLVWGSIGQLTGPDAAVHARWARRAMHRTFPQLEGIGFEQKWFGWIGMTGDHLPRLHLLGPNAIAVNGYNGRGIAPGTVFGKALSAHVTGDLPLEEMPLPVSGLSRAAMRHGRSLFYRAGSLAAHLVSGR